MSQQHPNIPPSDRPFVPPTAEQMVHLFEKHPPMPRAGGFARFHLVLLGLLVVMLVWRDNIVAQVLPWVALLGVLGFHTWRARMLQQLEHRVTRVSELATLRHYPNCLRLAWGLLPDLVRYPEMHGRTVGVMAFSLDQMQSYEAAIVAYDYLIERMPDEHPTSVQLRVQRTIAQLENDQLADADDAIRRLRGAVENYPHSALSAAYRFAQVLQQTRTNHFEDVVAEDDTLLGELRPLGAEAGFAYGLAALAHIRHEERRRARRAQAEQEQEGFTRFSVEPAPDSVVSSSDEPMQPDAASPEPESAVTDRARLWWSRATLLLAPDALVRRLPELQYVVEQGVPHERTPFEGVHE